MADHKDVAVEIRILGSNRSSLGGTVDIELTYHIVSDRVTHRQFDRLCGSIATGGG